MEDLYLPKIKRINYFEDPNIMICETPKMRKINLNKVTKKNHSFLVNEVFDVDINSWFKKKQSLNCDPDLIETNTISVSLSDLLSLANVTELSEPSSKVLFSLLCSGSLSEYPDSLSLSCVPVLSSSLNENLINIEPIKEKEHSLDLYNKTDLNDFSVTMITPKENFKINEYIKVLPTEDCDRVENVFKTQTLKNGSKDSQTKNFERFIKGLDFIDPDIIYNIRLKEHTSQMTILVRNMSKCTDDNQMLEEYKKLKPVPQSVHKKCIVENRLNFFKSIYKWKYDIDTADQDKIMVEFAANFSNHAGTKVVNEENTIVLADVSIDECIKNLAAMKNNIDVKFKSLSNPDDSLQKKIVIKNLIINYENYIYDIRDKLIKKYSYLQRVINKYIKFKSIKVIDINTTKENTKNYKITKFKNAFINIETEQAQQVNNDTDDQKTVENTQPNAMVFSLLQPSDNEHPSCTSFESIAFNFDKNPNLGENVLESHNKNVFDTSEHLKEAELFYDSVSNSDSNKDLSLNNENVNTSRKRLHSLEIEEAENNAKLFKLLKDFDANFIDSSSVIKNNIFFNSTVLNKPDEDYFNSKPTPDQTEYENVIKENEYSIEDNIDMAFSINTDDSYDLNILFVDNYIDFM